jgi:hypothetical protein
VLELIAPINPHIARVRTFTLSEMPRNSLPVRLRLPLLFGLYLEATVKRLQEWPAGSAAAAAAMPDGELGVPPEFRQMPEGAFIDEFVQRFMPSGLGG